MLNNANMRKYRSCHACSNIVRSRVKDTQKHRVFCFCSAYHHNGDALFEKQTGANDGDPPYF